MSTAATHATKPIAEPIERSISPAIRTTVNPAAIIDIEAACSNTLNKLFDVRKYGDSRDNKPHIRRRAKKIPHSRKIKKIL
tara:strand:- start:56 stop:298 length:243 start_codon:yes stop_codon:yes gene_type:complete